MSRCGFGVQGGQQISNRLQPPIDLDIAPEDHPPPPRETSYGNPALRRDDFWVSSAEQGALAL